LLTLAPPEAPVAPPIPVCAGAEFSAPLQPNINIQATDEANNTFWFILSRAPDGVVSVVLGTTSRCSTATLGVRHGAEK
jgi:hypothetical protein